MSRIAYVNGRYRPQSEAKISIEDRGFQFADGVYEVCEVKGGRLIDERRHMARLDRSLAALSIARPMTQAALAVVLRETVARNRVRDGIVYVQITRGTFAQRSITIGALQDQRTEVADGLTEADRVVTQGSVFLQFANSYKG